VKVDLPDSRMACSEGFINPSEIEHIDKHFLLLRIPSLPLFLEDERRVLTFFRGDYEEGKKKEYETFSVGLCRDHS